MGVQVTLLKPDLHSFGSGIAGSYDNSIFSFVEVPPYCFPYFSCFDCILIGDLSSVLQDNYFKIRALALSVFFTSIALGYETMLRTVD
jgi:hypothetical protein